MKKVTIFIKRDDVRRVLRESLDSDTYNEVVLKIIALQGYSVMLLKDEDGEDE